MSSTKLLVNESITETELSLRGRRLAQLLGIVLIGLVGMLILSGVAAADAPDCTSVVYDGAGTAGNPWQVGTLDQLQCVSHENSTVGATDHYVQTADIDASETATWNGGAGFEPIAPDYETGFEGVYDGDGYRITGLTINRSFGNHIGFIGNHHGTLTAVYLHNATIHGRQQVGGLMARGNGTILDSTITGTVTASASSGILGGVTGYAFGSGVTIHNVTATGTVDNAGDTAGGLVGWMDNGTITHSSVAGTVTAGSDTGGAIGDMRSGSLSNVTASVNVSGTERVGGLIGNIWTANADSHPSITDVAARGTVNGSDKVGGLIGYADVVTSFEVDPLQVTLNRSYAVGATTGQSGVGGMIGDLDFGPNASLSVSSGYWDIEATGQTEAVGNGTHPGFQARTTDEMQGTSPLPSADDTMAGFDFSDTWTVMTVPDDYPQLVWENITLTLEEPTLIVNESTNATVTSPTPDGGLQNLTSAATFATDDPTVVTVSDTGTVTAVSNGQTNVIATVYGRTVRIPVVVTDDTLDALPESYHGTLTINGEPAVPGTTVEAHIDGEVRGSITLTETGTYGSTESFEPQLTVNGSTSEIGDAVTFRVIPAASQSLLPGVATETSPFAPDNTTERNLTATLEAPAPPVYGGSVASDGSVYTIGFPGPVNGTIGDVFPNGTDGINTIYHHTVSGWEQVYDPNYTLSALDAIVFTTSETGPASVDLEVRLQNDTVATNRTLTPGWNLVTAPARTDAQDAFGVEDAILVVDRYGQPSLDTVNATVPGFDHYVVDSTTWGVAAPAVNPFTGYFVYATAETTVPVRATDFPYRQAADDLLELSN